MKIQLGSTLPFTPVQLDSKDVVPRRSVGVLHGRDEQGDYRMPVYQFRHDDNDHVDYQIDSAEKVYIDESGQVIKAAAESAERGLPAVLSWVSHTDSMTYKPYAFLVMNAITKLVGEWDGVVYRTPSGERLRESASNATMQVVDACVCNRLGLWVMVNLLGESAHGLSAQKTAVRQLGWVRL